MFSIEIRQWVALVGIASCVGVHRWLDLPLYVESGRGGLGGAAGVSRVTDAGEVL